MIQKRIFTEYVILIDCFVSWHDVEWSTISTNSGSYSNLFPITKTTAASQRSANFIYSFKCHCMKTDCGNARRWRWCDGVAIAIDARTTTTTIEWFLWLNNLVQTDAGFRRLLSTGPEPDPISQVNKESLFRSNCSWIWMQWVPEAAPDRLRTAKNYIIHGH